MLGGDSKNHSFNVVCVAFEEVCVFTRSFLCVSDEIICVYEEVYVCLQGTLFLFMRRFVYKCL